MVDLDRSTDEFFRRIQSMRHTLRMIFVVICVVLTTLAAVGYFSVGLVVLRGELRSETTWSAMDLAEHATGFELSEASSADRLDSYVRNLQDSFAPLAFEIRNADAHVLHRSGNELPTPTISWVEPIIVGATTIGELEASASLEALLIETVCIVAAGLLSGALFWFAMKRLPERSFEHSLKILSDVHSQSKRYAEEMNHAYEKLQVQYRLNEEITDELKRARDMAVASAQSKSAFLANMSHEFRTPLNAIIGFSEMMSSQCGQHLTAEDMRKYANDIFESGHHLLGIVNDILDLAKIDAGKLRLEMTPVDLYRVVNDCRTILSKSAEDTGVRIVVDQPEQDVRYALADQLKVKQIILNLMANAVKFTHEGGQVSLSLSNEGVSDVAIVVTDTGIGMTEEGIAAALEPFQQLDNSLSRRFEGTGLGLPLTKSLVDMHGGWMNIQSSPNVGTTVTVILPSIDPISVLVAAGPATNANRRIRQDPVDLATSA